MPTDGVLLLSEIKEKKLSVLLYYKADLRWTVKRGL
jgi:hypothetical protein